MKQALYRCKSIVTRDLLDDPEFPIRQWLLSLSLDTAKATVRREKLGDPTTVRLVGDDVTITIETRYAWNEKGASNDREGATPH